MNLTIEFTETDAMFLRNAGFTMDKPDGTPAASFDTNVAGGFPIIRIHEGIHKGKTFIIKANTLQKFISDLINDKEKTDDAKTRVAGTSKQD